MNAPFARTFRLVSRGGAGLACDDDGVALGPVSLVEAFRDERGKLRFRAKPLADLGKAMRLAYGDAEGEAIARHHKGLSRIAELLAAGESTRARIHAVQLGFPDIGDDGMEKLARAENLGKLRSWTDERRNDNPELGGGFWVSSTNGASATPKTQPKDSARASKKPTAGVTPAEKQKFVDDHLAAAQEAAKQLDLPVENILGLSALEGGWGKTSRFAREGNNFLSIYYPAPYAVAPIPAKDKTVTGHTNKLSAFASYGDCLQSFVRLYDPIVHGIDDPEQFATILQQHKKYGINPDNGEPMPHFVHDVAATIRGLRPYIGRSKARQ